MSIKRFIALLSLLLISLAACQAAGPATPTPAAGVTPTATPRPIATCADLDAAWGKDWPAVLDTLEQLIAAGQSCGEQPLLSTQYAAHFNYASVLEEKEELEPAIAHYGAALALDPQRQEALNALIRLQALPKPTPAACLSAGPPRPDPAPAATPDTSQFVTVQGDRLQLNGRPFNVKGLNYYPRRAPWGRFLTEARPAEMAEELDLIRQAGFNTLRVFLWYEPLFTCQPEDAIPNEAAFAVFDALAQLARERDLKLIVTLNDLPDLTFRPLYTDYDHYDNQTVYIIRRYRNEPAILAWDLRNEGDRDYGAQSEESPLIFEQAEVLAWLAHASQLAREHDPYHLLTAGWWGDPLPTGPYVDILAFQSWDDEADQLQARLDQFKQAADKPLLLQAIGYSSLPAAPGEPPAEARQAEALGQALRIVEAQAIAGWLVWTAFDFTPEPGQPANKEHYFGMWRPDLSPKPVLEALPFE